MNTGYDAEYVRHLKVSLQYEELITTHHRDNIFLQRFDIPPCPVVRRCLYETSLLFALRKLPQFCFVSSSLWEPAYFTFFFFTLLQFP